MYIKTGRRGRRRVESGTTCMLFGFKVDPRSSETTVPYRLPYLTKWEYVKDIVGMWTEELICKYKSKYSVNKST